MRKLVLNKKTGFNVLPHSSDIVIRDSRGIIFYDTRPLEKKVKKFNLPKGIYFIESGAFREALFPVFYNLAKLPKPERNYPNPFNYDVMFANNPHKCTIDWNNKVITFDNSFKEKPLYVVNFILFHEFAHKLYSTEKNADLLAANYMLKRGYNPSQIGNAPLYSLSDAQYERKSNIINQIL
jgi:hypothetical protein